MGNIKTIFKNVADLWSLVVGLGVTGDNFLKKQVTVHYPRKEVKNLASFRGPVELVPKPKDPAKPKCIACMLCMSVCPSKCITVIKKKPPKPTPEEEKAMAEAEAKGEKIKKPSLKEPGKFIYDYSLCSLCGLCSEVCPVKSIRYSNQAYLVSDNPKAFKMDLLARLAEKARGQADSSKEAV